MVGPTYASHFQLESRFVLKNGAVASDRATDIGSVRDDRYFPILAMLALRAGYNESREQIYDKKLASMLGEYVVPLLGQKTPPSRLVVNQQNITTSLVMTRQPKRPLDEVLDLRRSATVSAQEKFSKPGKS